MLRLTLFSFGADRNREAGGPIAIGSQAPRPAGSDVFAWLVKYADHEPDWADGCIAVLCGYHKGLKVWTYDREFQTTWRRADGKAIALAIK